MLQTYQNYWNLLFLSQYIIHISIIKVHDIQEWA